jgi:hypothetical protein
MNEDEMATLAAEIVGRIRPLLAGHPSEVQGAALAHLTGTWLAGHRSRISDAKALRKYREKLLVHQIDFIWQHVDAEDTQDQS